MKWLNSSVISLLSQLFRCLVLPVLVLDHSVQQFPRCLVLAHPVVYLAQEHVLRVHQVHVRAVVELVPPPHRVSRQLLPLPLYPEPPQSLQQLRVASTTPRHSNHLLAEVFKELAHHFRSIALGVDGYKYYFEFQVGTLGQVADDSVAGGQVVEGSRAELRRICVAKEQAKYLKKIR